MLRVGRSGHMAVHLLMVLHDDDVNGRNTVLLRQAVDILRDLFEIHVSSLSRRHAPTLPIILFLRI